MAQVQYYGTGRRKSSVARVRLVSGEGRVIINGRDFENYIPFAALREVVKQPLVATETLGNYDVLVNVNGGGYTGQAGAIRHGISRALLKADPEYRLTLKRAGLLTRDARMKERKKYGLKGARRAPQFSKRNFCELQTQPFWLGFFMFHSSFVIFVVWNILVLSSRVCFFFRSLD